MSNSDIAAAMKTLTHGVYMLGVHTAEKDNLMTAAWLCQVSSSPPMLAAAVGGSHLTADLIRQAGQFSVSVLSQDQKETAIKCGTVSGRHVCKPNLVDVEYSEAGCPMIRGAISQLSCRVMESHALAGGHILFIAEVTGAASSSAAAEPLLYGQLS